MLGYVMVGTNDLPKATAFYDSLLSVIGGRKGMQTPKGQAFTFAGGPMLIVTTPWDNGEATVGNGSMIALSCQTKEQVTAMHAKALELGGTCEGEPGQRGGFGEFAYFRDLDGNKLCAFKFNG